MDITRRVIYRGPDFCNDKMHKNLKFPLAVRWKYLCVCVCVWCCANRAVKRGSVCVRCVLPSEEQQQRQQKWVSCIWLELEFHSAPLRAVSVTSCSHLSSAFNWWISSAGWPPPQSPAAWFQTSLPPFRLGPGRGREGLTFFFIFVRDKTSLNKTSPLILSHFLLCCFLLKHFNFLKYFF